MMMDDEEGEMHLRNLKLYEATTEEVRYVCIHVYIEEVRHVCILHVYIYVCVLVCVCIHVYIYVYG